MKLNKTLSIAAISTAALFFSGVAQAESAVSIFNAENDSKSLETTPPPESKVVPTDDSIEAADLFIYQYNISPNDNLMRTYFMHEIMGEVAKQKISKPDFVEYTRGEKSGWHIIRHFYVKNKAYADRIASDMKDAEKFLLYKKRSTQLLCKDAFNDALMDRGVHFEYVYHYKNKVLSRVTISGNACAY